VHLIPAGSFGGRDGRGPYSLDAEAVLTAFSEAALPLVIDYEHQTQAAPENGQAAPAAGWVDELAIRADGLYGRVTWTARAREMIQAREYRYISPVFEYIPDTGRVCGLVGAGLTNRPNLRLTALNRAGHQTKGTEMEWKKQLRALFGLSETADDAAIAAALDNVNERLATPAAAEMRRGLKLPVDAGLVRIIEAVAAHRFDGGGGKANDEQMKGSYTKALERIIALEKQAGEAAVEKLVADARAAHKITPAMEPSIREYAAADIEACRRHIAALPVVALSAHARTAASGKPPASTDARNPLIADAERRAATK
jgi:phage I-like protein